MDLFGIEPLTPAYGKKYGTAKEALADFEANRDFQTPSSAYTSKRELVALGFSGPIIIRFGNKAVEAHLS